MTRGRPIRNRSYSLQYRQLKYDSPRSTLFKEERTEVSVLNTLWNKRITMSEGPELDVGREGEDNQTETIGMEEMLYAAKSTLENAEDERIFAEEYHLKLISDSFQYQFGGIPDAIHIVTSDDTAMLVNTLRETFEAVEMGSIKEDEYFFELMTPNLYYTSGNYRPSEQAQTTLLALIQTYQYESGNTRLQANNVSILVELLVVNNLENSTFSLNPDYDQAPPPPQNGIRESNVSRFKLKAQRQTQQIMRNLLRAFGTRLVGGKWSNLLMIQFTVVFCVQVLLVGAIPVNVEPDSPLTLTAGSDGVIPFECRNEQQSASTYYTVKFEEKDRPFCIDGAFDPEGLMSPDQAERFRVDYFEQGSSMSVEINIESVSIVDQGTYIVVLIIQGETTENHLMKRVVQIFIPPGPAVCFLVPSERIWKLVEVHCHSKPGNGNSTLTCFQNGDKIPYRWDGLNTQIVYSRTFWLMHIDIPLSCCSHDIKEMFTITQTSCEQFTYPRIEPANGPVPPVDEIPTKITQTTRPLSMEEKNNQPSPETSSCSRCGAKFEWLTVMLPLMALFTYYVCISNP